MEIFMSEKENRYKQYALAGYGSGYDSAHIFIRTDVSSPNNLEVKSLEQHDRELLRELYVKVCDYVCDLIQEDKESKIMVCELNLLIKKLLKERGV